MLKCVAKFVPTKATNQAAAFDVYAPKSGNFLAGTINRIDLELYVEIPSGYYGQLAARSGFAVGYGMHVLGGVIDSDYRGSLNLIATSITNFTYEKGDRIAQLIILPIAPFDRFECVDTLTTTDRGTGGFGSTGV